MRYRSARLVGTIALAAVAVLVIWFGLAGWLSRVSLLPSRSGPHTSPPVTLAESPWPKCRGNAGNTGRGVGSGATGQVKWTFHTGGTVEGGTAIGSDGTVYVWSCDGFLYAIEPTAGTLKWKTRIAKRSSVNFMTPTPLVLSNGTIVIGSGDGSVYAVQAADGKIRWSFRTGRRLGKPTEVRASAAVGPDGILYVPSRGQAAGDALYALDSSTGRQRWGLELGSMQSAPAVADDGTVYVGTDQFCAIDGSTGSIKWTLPIHAGTPAISEAGDIYAGGSMVGPVADKYSRAFAIDVSGTIKWSVPIVPSSMLVTEPAIGLWGLVYFASSDGVLHALRQSDGSMVWEASLLAKGATPTPVVAADGTVYATAFENGVGKLVALDGKTGEREWGVTAGNGLGRAAAIDGDGTIYIGSWQGDVYAIH